MRSDMIGIGVRRGRRARAKPMRMRFYVIGRLFGGPARAPQGGQAFSFLLYMYVHGPA